MRIKIDKLIICALLCAVISVSSQIIIPIGVVPISLATLSVMICGGVLGTKYGITATILYILIGAIGVPVFSGLRGGISFLFGPTGGYIIGYLFIAGLSGVAFSKRRKAALNVMILCLSNIICYIVGTFWYILITKTELFVAISVCVLPFIVGDVVKIAIAYSVIVRIKKQI